MGEGDTRQRILAALRAVPLLLSLGAAACASPPADVEPVTLESRSYGFIDELLGGAAGRPETVDAVLALPTAAEPRGRSAAPYPALVLLHTSNGQGSQDWQYLRQLREEGIAVLAVDSFTARGVSHTVRDQFLVSTASMLADAYAGLALLRADPRIDPRRIGVMGFSKGGIAALYAAYQPIRKATAGGGGEAFALHIAYYPWCGLRLNRPLTTGAPVLIQTGALDDLVPPEGCRDLIAASRGPAGPSGMRLVVHEGARHAFDHPMLSLFGNLPISAPSPANCRVMQQPDGAFVEAVSGTRLHRANLHEALAGCSRSGHAGGNGEAAEEAWAETLAFLEAAGLRGP